MFEKKNGADKMDNDNKKPNDKRTDDGDEWSSDDDDIMQNQVVSKKIKVLNNSVKHRERDRDIKRDSDQYI